MWAQCHSPDDGIQTSTSWKAALATRQLLEGELLSTAPLKQPNPALTTPHAVKGKQYARA